MKFAKIIDKGECYSTLNLKVNEIFANREEWRKYNFYPKNGMVGIVITVSGYIVLKIKDGIYVPMASKGIQYIDEEEFNKGQINNVCCGMDERQTKLNKMYDNFQSSLVDDLFSLFR